MGRILCRTVQPCQSASRSPGVPNGASRKGSFTASTRGCAGSVYPLRGLAEHPSDSASAAWPIDSSENWSPKTFPQHIFGFKTGRKEFQFPPLQGFMARSEERRVGKEGDRT